MMTRLDALQMIAETCADLPIVVACAASSREMASLGRQPNHFYLYDQLGMSCSIGFGVAVALEKSRFPKVVAIEGDGGMLFSLSTLATIGSVCPRKLLLIVLDNEAYASTGGQVTASPKVNLTEMAAAAGIAATDISTPEELRQWLAESRRADGPHFARVRISGSNAKVARLWEDPPLLAHDFSTFVQTHR